MKAYKGESMTQTRRVRKGPLTLTRPPAPGRQSSHVLALWGSYPQRHGLLRYDPCATCQAMLAEVQARIRGGSLRQGNTGERGHAQS